MNAKRIVLTSCLLSSVVWAGCNEPQPAADKPTPLPSVTLRVLVVNDGPMAEAIGRLRGEWAARSGGSLEATVVDWQSLVGPQPPEADVIIFSSRYLGALCQRDFLRPVRNSVLTGKQFDADDLLPLVREELIRYGTRVMALPLGVHVMLVGYGTAWQTAERPLPETWSDYYKQAAVVRQSPEWWPSSGGSQWAAMMLLARAAPSAAHPNREGLLFDLETFEPQITSPPFVHALAEWRNSIDAGAEAVTAPGKAEAVPRGVLWAELPGAAEVFNPSFGEWESVDGPPQRLPLVSGVLAGVTNGSRNAASAFELLAWLTSREITNDLSRTIHTMLPARRSQLAAAGAWVDLSSSGASRLGETVRTSLGRRRCMLVPRLPGVDEYLTTLATAVRRALAGEVEPLVALQEAAREWELITDRHDRSAQSQAYAQHLGILKYGEAVP